MLFCPRIMPIFIGLKPFFECHVAILIVKMRANSNSSYHLYPSVTMCAALNPRGTFLLLTFCEGVLM